VEGYCGFVGPATQSQFHGAPGFPPERPKYPERSAKFRSVLPEPMLSHRWFNSLGKWYVLCLREAGRMSSPPTDNTRKIVDSERTSRDYRICR
jgi:hypothetical protein